MLALKKKAVRDQQIDPKRSSYPQCTLIFCKFQIKENESGKEHHILIEYITSTKYTVSDVTREAVSYTYIIYICVYI